MNREVASSGKEQAAAVMKCFHFCVLQGLLGGFVHAEVYLGSQE